MKINRWTALGLATAGAVGLGVAVAGTTTERSAPTTAGAKAPVADMLAARSPGARGNAAVSSKAPIVHQALFTPTYAPSALGERTPAEGPKLAMAAPVATPAPVAAPATAIAPAVLAPTPVPSTAVAAAGAPVAIIPAAAAVGGSSLGAGALLPIVPLALLAGSGGGGGSTAFAPAVPEPSTWMMMISGFGVLGFALRRRRRLARLAPEGSGDAAASGKLAVARAR